MDELGHTPSIESVNLQELRDISEKVADSWIVENETKKALKPEDRRKYKFSTSEAAPGMRERFWMLKSKRLKELRLKKIHYMKK